MRSFDLTASMASDDFKEYTRAEWAQIRASDGWLPRTSVVLCTDYRPGGRNLFLATRGTGWHRDYANGHYAFQASAPELCQDEDQDSERNVTRRYEWADKFMRPPMTKRTMEAANGTDGMEAAAAAAPTTLNVLVRDLDWARSWRVTVGRQQFINRTIPRSSLPAYLGLSDGQLIKITGLSLEWILPFLDGPLPPHEEYGLFLWGLKEYQQVHELARSGMDGRLRTLARSLQVGDRAPERIVDWLVGLYRRPWDITYGTPTIVNNPKMKILTYENVGEFIPIGKGYEYEFLSRAQEVTDGRLAAGGGQAANNNIWSLLTGSLGPTSWLCVSLLYFLPLVGLGLYLSFLFSVKKGRRGGQDPLRGRWQRRFHLWVVMPIIQAANAVNALYGRCDGLVADLFAPCLKIRRLRGRLPDAILRLLFALMLFFTVLFTNLYSGNIQAMLVARPTESIRSPEDFMRLRSPQNLTLYSFGHNVRNYSTIGPWSAALKAMVQHEIVLKMRDRLTFMGLTGVSQVRFVPSIGCEAVTLADPLWRRHKYDCGRSESHTISYGIFVHRATPRRPRVRELLRRSHEAALGQRRNHHLLEIRLRRGMRADLFEANLVDEISLAAFETPLWNLFAAYLTLLVLMLIVYMIPFACGVLSSIV